MMNIENNNIQTETLSRIVKTTKTEGDFYDDNKNIEYNEGIKKNEVDSEYYGFEEEFENDTEFRDFFKTIRFAFDDNELMIVRKILTKAKYRPKRLSSNELEKILPIIYNNVDIESFKSGHAPNKSKAQQYNKFIKNLVYFLENYE
jgi:hypothetical protein